MVYSYVITTEYQTETNMKSIPYVKFDWSLHGDGLRRPVASLIDDTKISELQSEWEQSTDPNRPSWLAFLAQAVDNSASN